MILLRRVKRGKHFNCNVPDNIVKYFFYLSSKFLMS